MNSNEDNKWAKGSYAWRRNPSMRRRNRRNPPPFTHGLELAKEIFPGRIDTLTKRRNRRRWRHNPDKYSWGTLYPEKGGSWGEPAISRTGLRRWRRNPEHTWDTLYPEKGGSWGDPPIHRAGSMRRRRKNPGHTWDTLYPEKGGSWGDPVYSRAGMRRRYNPGYSWDPIYSRARMRSNPVWGTLYPEKGGNWGDPIYKRARSLRRWNRNPFADEGYLDPSEINSLRRRRNPAGLLNGLPLDEDDDVLTWKASAPTQRWTPGKKFWETEEETPASARRRMHRFYRGRRRRRNPEDVLTWEASAPTQRWDKGRKFWETTPWEEELTDTPASSRRSYRRNVG